MPEQISDRRENFVPCSPSTTSPRPNDSLAPARSALAGLRFSDSFRRFPSGESPHFVAERETESSGMFRAFLKDSMFSTERSVFTIGSGQKKRPAVKRDV